MDDSSTASSLDLLPLLPTMEPRMNALITSYAPPALSLETKVQAPRTAPAGQQRNNESAVVVGSGTTNNQLTNASQISFALEFERAKTKVLAHEVQKLRQSVVAHQQQQEREQQQQEREYSSPPLAPHFSPPKLSHDHHHQHQKEYQSPQKGRFIENSGPIKLTPESMARTRLIAEARVTAKRHDVEMQDRINDKAQRIFDWRDPEFIRRKVMLETNLALVKYRAGGGGGGGPKGRKRSRKQASNSNINHPSSSFIRDMQKVLREERWSNAGGSSLSIPEYDVTKDPHSVGWIKTRTFKQSPYSKMIQSKQAQLPSNFHDMPRNRNHEELAMQIQAQIAAERVSAATEAVAECEERQETQRKVDIADNQHGNTHRPSTPAQQINAEIELFRTIILREGLLGMAASISAEVIAGDLTKLGKPRSEMAEKHSILSHLESKSGINGGSVGFLQPSNSDEFEQQLTLLSVLDQLRCTTVRTVEALINWQKRRLEVEAREMVKFGQFDDTMSNEELNNGGLFSNPLGPERIPFIWDGVNYLLKIATDTDFLNSVRPLRRILGYPVIRNPFITPFSLDQLPPDPGPPAPLLPLSSNASSQELRAAGGGLAVDSVRIFKASVAILEEESAFTFDGGKIGGRQQNQQRMRAADGTLLPDWNRDNSIKDTRNILKMGLGININGEEIDNIRETSKKRKRVVGGGTGTTTDSMSRRSDSSKNRSFKLHPSDYNAVKRKTGIARSDITALVVYSVPPAGVKLALEALRTLLHPYCDSKQKTNITPLPRAMDLEWSSLRRLAMDRENLLRCMLQFPEAMPLRPPEKRRAMMAYLNDPTFDPDVIVRQSQSASLVVAWIRRVILAGLRAEKTRNGKNQNDNRGEEKDDASILMTNGDRKKNRQQTHPKADNTWGMIEYDDAAAADDEGDDEEDERRDGRAFKKLHDEISNLKNSLRNRGVLSDDERDDENDDHQEKPRKTWSRRRRLRSRGGGRRGGGGRSRHGQHTLFRTSQRILCENVDPSDENLDKNHNTIYAVLTCAMRYSDGWLVVSAHEPGGVLSCQVQLHPTYCTMLLGMPLADLSDLPSGDERDERMKKILEHLRASHSLIKNSSNNESRPAQLLLRFAFQRSIFTGIRCLNIQLDHEISNNQNQKKLRAFVALRVEFIDGSDVARRTPWSAAVSSTPSSSAHDLVQHDGGMVIFAWVQSHNLFELNEYENYKQSTPLVLVITKSELSLLFAHKDHLLKQGDLRAQNELSRVIVDHISLSANLDSRNHSSTPLLRLDIDRGIPLALQNDVVNVSHMPVLQNTRKHTRVKLTGRIEAGGEAVIFGLRPIVDTTTNSNSNNSSSSNTTIIDAVQPQSLRIMSTEIAALSAVKPTQALRLSPALGRVLDRIFYNVDTGRFQIDKSIVTMQCRISDEMLTVNAEVCEVGFIFRVQRIDEQGNPHEDKTSLHKTVRWDDARRLLERTGERNDIDYLLQPEQSATLAERVCTMLRLVEKDGAQLSLGGAIGGPRMGGGLNQQPAKLSDYRLETAMFRRMVSVVVAIERLGTTGNDPHGPPPPTPVGSISIDDSATLAQARDELRNQLAGHVNLPENFRFTWRGKPFTRAQEYYRTIAECLPSLQLRPVQQNLTSLGGRGDGGLSSLASLVGMPLEDIIEGSDSEYTSDAYVSGSVMSGLGQGGRSVHVHVHHDGGGGGRGRHKRRRGGASDTEAGKKKGGKYRSLAASKNAKRKVSKTKKVTKRKRGKNRGADSSHSATGNATGDELTSALESDMTTGVDAADSDVSTASEDSFEEMDEEAIDAMDETAKAEYNRRKRLSEVRRFEEVDDETLATYDEEQILLYEKLKEESKIYREERLKRKQAAKMKDGDTNKGGKKRKKKKKKKKKGKKTPAFMKMTSSKMAALKAKKEKRKKKLSKAEEEKKQREEKAKKKRKERPKSPEEKDYERLLGTCMVEAGSKVITTTEVLAGQPLDRQSRIRLGKKRKDGTLENLYWLSQDPEDVFGGPEGKTLTLKRPYNDWSESAVRIYLCKNELAEEPVEEEVKGDEIREDELTKKEKFFGYEMFWVDIIPMLGTEPLDLHQTKEQWYPKVTCEFAAKKTFIYLCALKPTSKELDGSKFTKFCKNLPDVVDGKKIKATDIDIIFAKAKEKDQRRLKFKEFFNNALVMLAEKRYPWLDKCGDEGGEGPACREFIRQHIFKWDVCSDLVWEVRNIYFVCVFFS
jgi:hypothetical protein